MEDAIIPFALLCFTSFFTLTNPLGTMPVFLTMTNGMDEKERKHIVEARYYNLFYHIDSVHVLRTVPV